MKIEKVFSFYGNTKNAECPKQFWKKKNKISQTKIGTLNLKYLAMPEVGKEMEQREFSYLTDENVRWCFRELFSSIFIFLNLV